MAETESALRVLHQRARSLRVEVDKVNPDPPRTGSGRSGSGLSAFTRPFNNLLQSVRSAFPAEASGLQQLSTLNELEELDEGLSPNYHRQRKHEVLIGCRDIEAVLEAHLSSSVEVPAMKVTREGVYFAGQPYSAIQWITGILLSAKKSIVIVDNFVDHRVLKILEGKTAAVVVGILTKAVLGPLHVAAEAFNKEYDGLSVRTSDAFHDRFVVVDSAEFYHLGASIKDLGMRGFMYSRIEEKSIIDLLTQKLDEEWKRAKQVIKS
jgi:hypothetical protein